VGSIPRYLVRRRQPLPDVADSWNGPTWYGAETLAVSSFHPGSRGHRPVTQVRLLHNRQSLAVIFRVEDNYVLARATQYQAATHKDSCVEFFVRPRQGAGYFNFEFNAIGTLRLWYIDKPRRPDGSFEAYTPVPIELARGIQSYASLQGPILDERVGHSEWTVSFQVPCTLFEAFVGPIADLSGQVWDANFFKCADESSRPHWGYWADIGERLDFHQPERFGQIVFE
jgi:hypothetical protein